jgi:hypothetical protein
MLCILKKITQTIIYVEKTLDKKTIAKSLIKSDEEDLGIILTNNLKCYHIFNAPI